jgi:hypothetical protein
MHGCLADGPVAVIEIGNRRLQISPRKWQTEDRQEYEDEALVDGLHNGPSPWFLRLFSDSA